MPFGRQGRPGLLGSVARTSIISGTPQMTIAAIDHRSPNPQVRPHPASRPLPPMTGGDQLADQLARLANLHSTGVLTAEEFAAAKSRLLA